MSAIDFADKVNHGLLIFTPRAGHTPVAFFDIVFQIAPTDGVSAFDVDSDFIRIQDLNNLCDGERGLQNSKKGAKENFARFFEYIVFDFLEVVKFVLKPLGDFVSCCCEIEGPAWVKSCFGTQHIILRV